MAFLSFHNKNKESHPVNSLAKYAGLGTQIIAGLLISLYLGKKMDIYFTWHNKAAWIFPSLFILFTLVMVVRDTQKKN
jgi:Ni/Fe-hydrogenase subunit HybB-like protein